MTPADDTWDRFQKHTARGGHVPNCQCKGCQDAKADWARLDSPHNPDRKRLAGMSLDAHMAEINDLANGLAKGGRYAAEAIAKVLLGETVVTNDRVLNHALQQASSIIGRRDISPLDKFEMLAAYVLKARRDVLGKPED